MSISFGDPARSSALVGALTALLDEGSAPGSARKALAAVWVGDSCWSTGLTRGGLARHCPPVDTRALVYSLTKSMMAAAVLRLAAAGTVALDEPLSRWLPALDIAGRVTLAQLLQHRAGLPDYGGMKDYHAAVAAGGEPWSEEEFLARCDPDRPVGALGGEFLYSNIGYLLIKRVLERAGGAPYPEVMRREVFEPLGLSSASVVGRRSDLQDLLLGPSPQVVGGSVAGSYHPGWVAHGVAAMTAVDAAGFLHRLSTTAYLPSDLFRRMTDFVPVPGSMGGRPWVEPVYGLGLMAEIDPDVGPYWGHTGGGPGCSSATYHFPGPVPVTVSVITDGEDGSQAEWMAVEAAYTLR